MKKNFARLAVLMLALVFALAMTAAPALAAKEMTITGKVEEGKITADTGQTYMVKENSKSKELMKDHMGHRVEVHGKVDTKGGEQWITVERFKHISAG